MSADPASAPVPRRASDAGFTLIESLVALAVLAVAAVALLGAAERHVARVDGLESRAVALWAAEERLARLTLDPAAAATLPAETVMLGRRLRVQAEIAATDDPELSRVDLAVGEVGRPGPLARLSGFVDAGGRAPAEAAP